MAKGNSFQLVAHKDGSVTKEDVEVFDGKIFRCLFTSSNGYPPCISDFICEGENMFQVGEEIGVLLEGRPMPGTWINFPLRHISRSYRLLTEEEEAEILSRQPELKAAKEAAELAAKEAEEKAEREEEERREAIVQSKYAEARETGKEVLINQWWDWNSEENCLENFMVFALPDGTDRLERILEY